LRALDQGFRLVADDRVVVWTDGGRLWGRAPATLSGLVEARGVGVLHVEALPFCEVVLLARVQVADRLPDPATETILDVPLPLLAVQPLETSAPAKLRRAMEAFDAAHKRRI
jgi:serine kinase of HPr protein (carbohydrate metabolism regulator)